MPIEPGASEDQTDWMSRCVPEMIDSGHPQDQAVAICLDMWRGRSGTNGQVKFTTSQKKAEGHNFILSDETPDRMGDVIRATGWDLVNFNKNPIALFAHDSRFPVGSWRNLHVDKEQNALVGTLELAKAGTSARIDEIRALVDEGILRATSVGFRELQSQPRRDKDGHMIGLEFTSQELVEASLVAVPANPAALMMAKRLKISAGTRALVFQQPKRDDATIDALCAEIDTLCRRLEQLQAPIVATDRAAADAIVAHLKTRVGLYPYHDGWRWAHDVLARELTKLR